MALALDGSVTGTWSSGSSFTTAALTTANAHDVIVAFVSASGSTLTPTVTSLSTTGVVWQGTARLANGPNPGQGETLELWYGVAAAALTAQVVTINLSGTPAGVSANAEASVFGISGANTSVISDWNSSLPASHNVGGSAIPTVTGVSTSNANDMIIAGVGSNTTQTVGTGFTLISAATSFPRLATQYEIVSTTQSNISVAFGSSSSGNNMIVDAVVIAGAAPPPPKFQNVLDLSPRQIPFRMEETWTWAYNLNLIGKDFMPAAFRKEVYELPPQGVEPNWRRSWEWRYNLNLIGKDQLPTGKIIYDRTPISTEPNPRRSWEWWYNLNLRGKDKLPNRQQDWPNPPRVIWYKSWEQIPMPPVIKPLPFNQMDWPLAKFVRLNDYGYIQELNIPLNYVWYAYNFDWGQSDLPLRDNSLLTWIQTSVPPGVPPIILVTDLHFKPIFASMGRMGHLGGLS